MLARLSRWTLALLGWSIRTGKPELRKYVLIAAPHTSNWDFPLGILASWALGLEARWLGKHTLFRPPFGWFFRAIGGIPVRRDQARNLIPSIAELFHQSDRLVLALAPEGTRSWTDHWKSGFYHMARAANVPIVMAYLDHGRKEIGLSEPFQPGDDIEAAFARIRAFYADRVGKHPERAGAMRPRERP